jgi:hypothetical protein
MLGPPEHAAITRNNFNECESHPEHATRNDGVVNVRTPVPETVRGCNSLRCEQCMDQEYVHRAACWCRSLHVRQRLRRLLTAALAARKHAVAVVSGWRFMKADPGARSAQNLTRPGVRSNILSKTH